MPSTEETLKSWSFLKDYQKHRKELVDRARFVYALFKTQGGGAPTKDRCKAVYGAGLDGSDLFVKEMAEKKRFLPRHRYQDFALLLAEYVVEKHWTEIEQP
jgi:hypothetical protein